MKKPINILVALILFLNSLEVFRKALESGIGFNGVFYILSGIMGLVLILCFLSANSE